MGAFTVKLPDFKKMFREMEKVTRQAARASVNDMAFEFKNKAFEVLDEKYTFRKPGFVKHQLKVTKVEKDASFDDMVAYSGSVQFGKFGGWAEPLGGDEPDRHRLMTPLARGNNMQNVVQTKAKLQGGVPEIEGDASP
jgi:hypothetical protein